MISCSMERLLCVVSYARMQEAGVGLKPAELLAVIQDSDGGTVIVCDTEYFACETETREGYL